MASILPGYEYDIFISYRQKDNKGDRWVSQFVDALKDELESTFKEEISVYFDINPHDGLLETHDVDESLKEKLKCLVFIPIVSRTYCDPKSFAWEHEFKVFVEQASQDQFGLKVKLPGGNVASRVLPVQIHDLDKADIKLCESVLDGVLRGVEFIHKASGVNRPLTSKDDLIVESGKVFYKDQVNKVANAIKDVLNSLTTKELSGDEAITEEAVVEVDKSNRAERTIRKKAREVPSVSFIYRLKNLVALSPKVWRIVALVLIVVSFGTFWLGRETVPVTPRALLRSDIPLTKTLERLGKQAFALSPDGEFLVYVMNQELNLKALNSDAPSVPIPGTTNSRHPFFSPDGKWIGFESFSDGKIMKVPLQGGNPIHICNLEGQSFGINWYENEIIFADGGGFYRVPDIGGSPELLYQLNISLNDSATWNPQLLPDNKTLLFCQSRGDGNWDIMTWQLGSKESPVVLVKNGRDGRYLNSGHIAYSFNNRLYVSKFDSRKNHIIPEPQVITTKPLYESTYIFYGISQFDFSDNGILVYYEQREISQDHLVWIENSGEITPITRDTKYYNNPVISSDAKKIAVGTQSEESNQQIEIINTELGTSMLFVENAIYPVWSKDNSSIIYVTGNQVFQKPIDLSTPPEFLFKLDSINFVALINLSSDGRYLVFDAIIPGRSIDIGYYDMVNSKVEMLEYYNTESNEYTPSISPDGKWIAFNSNYSGDPAIYVAPFPGPGPLSRVSLDSESIVRRPFWAPDMTALYYFTSQPDYELWKVKIQTSEDFSHEEPQSIFSGGYNSLIDDIEIHPDGDRFFAVQRSVDENQEPV